MPFDAAQDACRVLAKQAVLRKSTETCLVGSQLLQEVAAYALGHVGAQQAKGNQADETFEIILTLYMLAAELTRREKR